MRPYIKYREKLHPVEHVNYGENGINHVVVWIKRECWVIFHEEGQKGLLFEREDSEGGTGDADLDKVLVWKEQAKC